MTYYELAVRQVEEWRPDDAMNHRGRIAEEVLVVRAPCRAVCNDECRLSAATGASCALHVVRRSRRHIAEVDGVQRRDVHSQFHGGGADERGQESRTLLYGARTVRRQQLLLFGRAEPEALFADLPHLRLHLRGVLARLQFE